MRQTSPINISQNSSLEKIIYNFNYFFCFLRTIGSIDGPIRFCVLVSQRQDKPSNALDYFGTLGHYSPSHYNSADFIMDLINQDMKVREKLKEAYIQNNFFMQNWTSFFGRFSFACVTENVLMFIVYSFIFTRSEESQPGVTD